MPKGFKMTEETRRRMREAHTGLRLSEETKEKLRAQRLGWKMTEESKQKMRESWARRKESGWNWPLGARERASMSHKGLLRSPEHCQHLSQALKGRAFSESHKRRLSEAKMGRPGHRHTDEWKQMMSKVQTGRIFSSETIAKMAKAKVGVYDGENNPFFGKHHTPEAMAKILRNRSGARPNKVETQLAALITESRLPYRYVGDGQFILGGKCPDFLNVNGKKQVIELFGTYWHDVFDVAERTEHFRQYGFDTLVIWEDELKDPERVRAKVAKFSRRHHATAT